MIRLFISSTFKDMNGERNLIHSEIYPVLRDYGLKKGVNVDICDLRWGIKADTSKSEEDAIADIMRVCFKEVTDCKPYIVSIIGDYYGSTAKDPDRIAQVWNEVCDSKFDLPENTRDISLTQWELEFSVLSNQNTEVNALCLFREDKTINNERINELKARILRKAEENGDRIVVDRYVNLEEFKSTFIQNIEKFIDAEAENSAANWIEENQMFADAYTAERTMEFVGRKLETDLFKSFIISDNKSVLGYYGDSGIGKSTLLSYLYQESRSQFRAYYIPCGNAFRCNTYLDLIRQLIYFVQREINGTTTRVREDILFEGEAEKILEDLLQQYSRVCDHNELLIFVDAMDKLQVELKNNLVQIFLRNNVKLVCSQIETFENTGHQRILTKRIESMSREDAVTLLGDNLYKNSYSDAETDSVIKAIVDKREMLSPLYLSTVLSILKMHMADASDLDTKEEDFLSRIEDLPDDAYSLCWNAILEAASYVSVSSSSNVNVKALVMAAGLIAVSRHGLREQDLERILVIYEWRTVDFAAFRSFLAHFFRQQADGCWVFEHDIIRNGIIANYNYDCRTITYIQNKLYEYVLNDKLSDLEVKIKEGLYLSAKKGNCVLSLHLFKLLDNSAYPIRTIAAKELVSIIREDQDDLWLRMILNSDVVPVIKLVATLLELKSTDDFERRYPAMIFAEKFLRAAGLTSSESLENWTTQRSFEEQFAFAEMCTEYISMHDSLDTEWKIAEYISFPVSFFTQKGNISQMNDKEKRTAYKHLNSLLYTNNKYFKMIRSVSEKIINSYNADILDINDKLVHNEELDLQRLQMIRGMYISNIGQFYNAIEKYSEATEYHIQSLIFKAEGLFKLLKFEDLYNIDNFMKTCGISEKNSKYELKDINIGRHLSFWNSLEAELINNKALDDVLEEGEEISEQYDWAAIADAWLRIAVSYRTLGSDVNGHVDEFGADLELINLGIECLKIAVEMLSSPIAARAKKEHFVSIIRTIILANKGDTDSFNDDTKTLLVRWGSEASRYYMDNAIFVGPDESRKLRDALDKMSEWAKDAVLEKNYKDVCELMKSQGISIDSEKGEDNE